MTPEAREGLDELMKRISDAHCMLLCAAEVFGDYSDMTETHARAAVVVDRTVEELESIRNALDEWLVAHAPLRLNDITNEK